MAPELDDPALGPKTTEVAGHEVAVELAHPALGPKPPEVAGHEVAHSVLG